MLILIYCGHTENDLHYAALPYSNSTLIVARTNFWYDNHSRCYLLQKTYDTPSALIAAKLRRLPWDDLCESVEYLIEICLVLLQFHTVWKMRRNCSSTFEEICTLFACLFLASWTSYWRSSRCAGDLRHHDAHVTSLKLLTIPSVPHVASNGLSSMRRLSIQGPIFGPHVSFLWLFGYSSTTTYTSIPIIS